MELDTTEDSKTTEKSTEETQIKECLDSLSEQLRLEHLWDALSSCLKV